MERVERGAVAGMVAVALAVVAWFTADELQHVVRWLVR